MEGGFRQAGTEPGSMTPIKVDSRTTKQWLSAEHETAPKARELEAERTSEGRASRASDSRALEVRFPTRSSQTRQVQPVKPARRIH